MFFPFILQTTTTLIWSTKAELKSRHNITTAKHIRKRMTDKRSIQGEDFLTKWETISCFRLCTIDLHQMYPNNHTIRQNILVVYSHRYKIKYKTQIAPQYFINILYVVLHINKTDCNLEVKYNLSRAASEFIYLFICLFICSILMTLP
jgi:hypothetical protein